MHLLAKQGKMGGKIKSVNLSKVGNREPGKADYRIKVFLLGFVHASSFWFFCRSLSMQIQSEIARDHISGVFKLTQLKLSWLCLKLNRSPLGLDESIQIYTLGCYDIRK